MTIKEAVNSKAYKAFKELYQSGIYDERIYRRATAVLNKALYDMKAVDGRGNPLRVNYCDENFIKKNIK